VKFSRALRGIVEELMLELMYDLPSRKDVENFTVTRDLVEARTKAQVLTHPSAQGGEQQASA
jgi:ATP-dependent Clp protease ATP-binding subunit ClpX